MARIVVIGAVARDDVVRLREPLQPGGHLNGVAAGGRLGGGGANTAVALAAAGHPVTLLAAIGQDPVGDALRAELATAGVDTSQLARLARPTTRSLLLIDPGGERTVLNLTRCEEDEPPARLLDLPAEAVYVRSRRCDLAPLLAAKARSALVVAHLPPIEPDTRPAQILIASAADLDPAARRDPWSLGRAVAGDLLQWVVITAGAAGARAYARDQSLAAPAPVVQPVDTTGAGDAFAAGLLHALVGGRPMAEALAVAVRFGAEATLWATSALPASAVHRLGLDRSIL
jgi:sugar/nucleoside kinase (ribokinase family)